MKKNDLTTELKEKYTAFTDYIGSLSEEEYQYQYENKWSAAQQLDHIVLCVAPLVQVYGMGKAGIEQMFGNVTVIRDYETHKAAYLGKLREGGKAPSQYVPVHPEDREVLIGKLSQQISILCEKVNSFSEEELETLAIPHPLLGKIALKEMLYNAVYHVQHHQQQAMQNLSHHGNG